MINPQKLRALREKNGWTLDMLGGKCKPPVDRGTINRIEMGKSRPNSGTILRLATALGVQPEDLAEPPRPPERQNVGSKSRFETPLLDSNRNALSLVARRYGVKPRIILELAPSFFVILAERHLAERKEAYRAMEAALCQAETRQPQYLNLLGARPDNALFLESESIRKRDLFLDNPDDPDEVCVYNYEFETHSPFPVWLNEQLRSVSYDGKIHWWQRDQPPQFTSDVEDALWLTDGDKELAEYVATGHVALHMLHGDERNDPEIRLEALRRLRIENDQAEISIDGLDELLAEVLNNSAGNEEEI